MLAATQCHSKGICSAPAGPGSCAQAAHEAGGATSSSIRLPQAPPDRGRLHARPPQAGVGGQPAPCRAPSPTLSLSPGSGPSVTATQPSIILDGRSAQR